MAGTRDAARYIRDPDAPESVRVSAIAKATPVYDNAGQRLGEAEPLAAGRPGAARSR